MTTWELPTARSAYVVHETDAGLELAHWGRPVRVVPPRGTFETPADIAPLEFAAAGTRHVGQRAARAGRRGAAARARLRRALRLPAEAGRA